MMRQTEQRYILFNALLAGATALGQAFLVLGLTEAGYAATQQQLPLIGAVSRLGLLISAPTVLAALSGALLWRWSLRVGSARSLQAAALLQAGALLSIAWLPPWPWPLLGLALSGPAGVLLTLNTAPLMLQLATGAGVDRLFARSSAAALLATALGQAAAGALSAAVRQSAGDLAADGFRVAAVCGAVLAGTAALLPGRLRPGGRAAAADSAPGPPFSLTRQLRQLPAALIPAVGPLLTSLGAALFVPFIGVYLHQHYGADDGQLGFIFALITVSTGVATLIGPRLAQRRGRIGAIVVTQLPAIGCLLVLPYAPGLWAAGLLAALRGALMNLALPLYDAEAAGRAAADVRATQMAVVRGAGSAGYLIGPTLSLLLQAQIGFTGVIAVTAGLYLAGVAAMQLLVGRRSGTIGGSGNRGEGEMK
jgi:MFS transporter, DHA1 family, solute carrier family 18 (vesicular amine transporter), member 1/2